MTQPFVQPSAGPDSPEVFYPESDGRPMGETGFHVTALLALLQAFKDHLRASGRSDFYVAGDMFLYYEKGNPRANKAPDVMVILGVPGHERRTFKTWVEGTVPSVIVEVASEESWHDDLYEKRELYAKLGIAEYFVFDPLGDCLNPRLQGFRLQGGMYVPLIADASGALESERLGLRLVAEEAMLRLIDARTNEPILTADEQAERLGEERQRREQERRRAERERQRAQAAHERAQTADERAQEQRQRAQAADERAQEERQRAQAAHERADALAAEVARLKALLEDDRKKD